MVLSVILVESKIGIPEISALETEKSILVDKFFAEGGRDKKNAYVCTNGAFWCALTHGFFECFVRHTGIKYKLK